MAGGGYRGFKPPGTKGLRWKWQQTLDKEAAREALRLRFMQFVPLLSERHIVNACGVGHMFLRRDDGTFERSDDPEKILAALNSGDKTSYYVFTKDPNVNAMVDILNRTFDKPTEIVDVTHSGQLEVTLLDRLLRGRQRNAEPE